MSDDEDLTVANFKLLKNKRKGHKSQVTYFGNQLSGGKIKTLGELQSALTRLRLTYSRFDEVQTEIEITEPLEIETRYKFEDDYGCVESSILDLINDAQNKTAFLIKNSEAEVSGVGDKANSSSIAQSSASLKLPEIKLPSFDGDQMNWLRFRDIYLDLIHTNNRLGLTTKFHYLISCVKSGQAYHHIENLPITSDNYPIAWKTIYDNYNNENSIKRKHMQYIYEVEKPKEHSSNSLKSFINTIEKHYNAIRALGVDTTSWDLFLNHHLLEKLDNSSRVEIVTKTPHDKLLTYTEFIDILKKRVKVLESLSNITTKANCSSMNNLPSNNTMHKRDVGKSMRFRSEVDKNEHRSLVTNVGACPYCKGGHGLSNCSKFTDSKITPEERYAFTSENRLCCNCLTHNHKVSKCTAKPCQICNLKHNTLLHFGNTTSKKFGSNGSSSGNGGISNAGTSSNNNHVLSKMSATSSFNQSDQIRSVLPSDAQNTLCTQAQNMISSNGESNVKVQQILLATAIIYVKNTNGHKLKVRVLLDSGSQTNFITERVCQFLNIKKQPVSIPISGIAQGLMMIRHKVKAEVASCVSDYSNTLEFLVLPKITGNLPMFPFSFNEQVIPNHIVLADPLFFIPDKIDLLIGAEIYHEIMLGDTIQIVTELPPFQKSEFGYVISGKVEYTGLMTNCIQSLNSINIPISHVSTLVELSSQIEKFWQIEEISPPNKLSIEEKLCEEHYADNVSRDKTGRYSVSLPLKPNISELGESGLSAWRQFNSLERRLIKTPEVRSQYIQFMEEYLSLSHMELVMSPEQCNSECGKVFYLPHHAVLRESSTTTKLRVVFNASARSSTNISLNDTLMIGPTIQNDLFSVIIRFRKHVIGFTADIAKMYRQILIHENQRDLHRVWWRDSQDGVVKCFRMNTVTYGTASAPYLAIRTLKQLGMDEAGSHPISSKILLSDFYVDDLVSGTSSEAQAKIIKGDLMKLLKSGGFELRKWHSNFLQLSSDEEDEEITSVSVLGLKWNFKLDLLVINFPKFINFVKCTKRTVLSEIAQLYDPLGVCTPIILLAKLYMQSLWAVSKISWDDELSSEKANYWNKFKLEISKVNLSIPRCIIIPQAEFTELHAFGDASEVGYGCSIYLRSCDRSGNCQVKLLCAKSRIAPLNKQTIPRLELCAAVLTAQLAHKVKSTIDINFTRICLWSDSEITLYRIKSVPARFATFVANRISVIQDLTKPEDWYYVPSLNNPADLASRGLMPSEFKNAELWWNGPSYLQPNSSEWPKFPKTKIDPDQLELKKIQNSFIANNVSFDLIEKYSDLNKLLRVTAYVKRFIDTVKIMINNRKSSTLVLGFCKRGSITSQEMDMALKTLVKMIQHKEYKSEISEIQKGKDLSTRSKLKALTPFIDAEGLLRVGGRLRNATIPFDQKHQMVLPSHHSFSKLLVRTEHCRLLHAGPQALFYNIRLRFWIIGGRNLCRLVVHECVRCFRTRPSSPDQIMGQLPLDRVNPARAFLNIGIDFCGPFNAKMEARAKANKKVYISVFVCFSTKAVHLELVHDLSTPSFIAAFRRFVSRRGCPAHVYSDNATNFIGSQHELLELKKLCESAAHKTEILRFWAEENINWHTIPPRSPHFGGLWEAAVKSSKFHFKRVVGVATYTVEELLTLIAQIESCLNSRPLTPMSEDPSDLSVLTPGHFLIGLAITALPDPSLEHLDFNRLSRFQRMQYLLRQFWKRWSLEYLNHLQMRRKWNSTSSNVEVGAMVILKEDNIPPQQWCLARIVETHPGADGHVRVVTVKTQNSKFRRSITKICILPFDNPVEIAK